MKLIEILVRDLPKFGGWPDGVKEVEQDGGGELIEMGNNSDYYSDFRLELGDDWENEVVTHDEYEAALAASKEMLVNKPVAWDGQGFPPVGCECEIKRVADWMPVTIKFISDRHTIFTTFGGTEDCYQTCSLQFRPIRTEEERKRSDICDKIYGAMTNAERKDNRSDMAEAVYDAIAAGNIPGVKLEAPDA